MSEKGIKELLGIVKDKSKGAYNRQIDFLLRRLTALESTKETSQSGDDYVEVMESVRDATCRFYALIQLPESLKDVNVADYITDDPLNNYMVLMIATACTKLEQAQKDELAGFIYYLECQSYVNLDNKKACIDRIAELLTEHQDGTQAKDNIDSVISIWDQIVRMENKKSPILLKALGVLIGFTPFVIAAYPMFVAGGEIALALGLTSLTAVVASPVVLGVVGAVVAAMIVGALLYAAGSKKEQVRNKAINDLLEENFVTTQASEGSTYSSALTAGLNSTPKDIDDGVGQEVAKPDGYNLEHDVDEPKHDVDEPKHDVDEPKHDGDEPKHDGDEPKHDGDDPEHDGDDPEHDGDDPEHGSGSSSLNHT